MMGQLGEERLHLPVRIINKRRHHINIFHSLIHNMKKVTEEDMLNLDEDLQEDSRESVGNLDYTIVRTNSKEEEEEEEEEGERERVTTVISPAQLIKPNTGPAKLPLGKDHKVTQSKLQTAPEFYFKV
jgi:CO dehydrogenase/acetyl-CoA synthase beta subunit